MRRRRLCGPDSQEAPALSPKGNAVFLPCFARLSGSVESGHAVVVALDPIIDLYMTDVDVLSCWLYLCDYMHFNEDHTNQVDVTIGRYVRSPPSHRHQHRRVSVRRVYIFAEQLTRRCDGSR